MYRGVSGPRNPNANPPGASAGAIRLKARAAAAAKSHGEIRRAVSSATTSPDQRQHRDHRGSRGGQVEPVGPRRAEDPGDRGAENDERVAAELEHLRERHGRIDRGRCAQGRPPERVDERRDDHHPELAPARARSSDQQDTAGDEEGECDRMGDHGENAERAGGDCAAPIVAIEGQQHPQSSADRNLAGHLSWDRHRGRAGAEKQQQHGSAEREAGSDRDGSPGRGTVRPRGSRAARRAPGTAGRCRRRRPSRSRRRSGWEPRSGTCRAEARTAPPRAAGGRRGRAFRTRRR